MRPVDWNSETSVLNYATQLGKGQTVFKHPDRPNYNITHTERWNKYPDNYKGCRLIHQT